MEELDRLAHAARLGEPGALSAFVDSAYPGVWKLCAGLVDQQAADDLAQETFLRAMSALPRFRAEAAARTWILSIARNVCMDELRSRSRRRRRDDRLATGGVAETCLPDVGEEIAVHDLLMHLDPDRRAAFVLTQFLRLSYQDAADVCDCPAGTIRSRVARARDDLIAMLGHSSSYARSQNRRRAKAD